MSWTVEYQSSTRKQLRKLDPQVSDRIVRFMRERVANMESAYQNGHALSGQWDGFWRYRVGDYRVICVILEDRLLVHVVRVGHRSSIYDKGPSDEDRSLTGTILKLLKTED